MARKSGKGTWQAPSLKALAPALFFPLLVLFFYFATPNHLGDADRYYHFALAKIMHEQGAIHLGTLPQAEDIGWGNYFPDKEFLFHLLTRLGYSLGGEQGAAFSVLLAAAGIGVVLYLFALAWLPPLPAFLCALAGFATHSFLFRMLFLRPHVLAIFFFTLLAFALARRKEWLAAVAAAGFVLAYHAFYIPLLCAGLVGALAFLEKKKERNSLWRLAGFAAAGVALGLIVNPYFPSQIVSGLRIARIPGLLAGELHGVNFGLELFPLSAPEFLKFYLFPLAVVLLAARALRASFVPLFLLGLTGFFLLLSFRTMRAGEFLVPAAALLFPLAAAEWRARARYAAWLPAAAAVFQLGMLAQVARTEVSENPEEGRRAEAMAAVGAIPPGPAKVHNCEWDTAPYLLYLRPDLRFTDLLDPSYLYFHDRGLFWKRERWRAGREPDVFGFVRGDLNADYVLCRDSRANHQMASHPGFRQLFPPGGGGELRVYEVARKPSAAFVTEHWMNTFPMPGPNEARRYEPAMRKEAAQLQLPAPRTAASFPPSGGALTCTHLSPTRGEVERLRGANFLGVGGGEALRAWRNGKLIFESGAVARSIQALVPLSPPSSPDDLFDLLACTRAGGAFHGASLSLWSSAAAYSACRWKGQGSADLSASFSTDQETCLGTLAAPSLPLSLQP